MKSIGKFNTEAYAEFSEAYLDFARCRREDGTHYGTSGKCRKGTETGAAEAPQKKPRKKAEKAGVSEEKRLGRLKTFARTFNPLLEEYGLGGHTKTVNSLLGDTEKFYKAKDKKDQTSMAGIVSRMTTTIVGDDERNYDDVFDSIYNGLASAP